ncbi:MAG TPA: HAD family hydrolase, partial [Tepidisphaeraceae bacterium]|nr:HAD family hydrolase [Tepidisphaeraceae bacterium]
MKVVLFDLDDTLTDRQLSFGAFVPVFQKEYSQHLGPCDTERIDQAIITADRGGYRPKSEFFGELCQILPWLNRPSPDKLESFWRAHFGNCTIERPGARQLLVDLRSAGFRLAIITTGTAAMQNSKIHRLGLVTLVDAVLISETIGVKKPNAEIYNKAMQALASENSSALFVGDHPI